LEASQDNTFGCYLKGFRIKRELAIETVAQKTRIATHCLRAIEEDAHDRLPPPAYVKSFLRIYAHAVGANADVAVDLYRSDLKRREHAKQQKLKRRAKLGTVRRTLTAAGLIVTILLLVRFATIFLDPEPSPGPQTPEPTVMPVSPAPEIEAAGKQPSATDPKDKLKLQVVAVERTWLKVIVDGEKVRSYDLKPEDRLELEGTTSFNLMIGNATGLEIVLDDRPVKIFGSSGQVVSLKIP
jgi:hypothetical protein